MRPAGSSLPPQRLNRPRPQVEQAKLNLSYTVITSPVNGITSAALQQDGTYINPQNSQLTTVEALSPMWVNFSLSENELQSYRDQIAKGKLSRPERQATMMVEDHPGRRLDIPLYRKDHLCRAVLQFADRHVSAAGKR